MEASKGKTDRKESRLQSRSYSGPSSQTRPAQSRSSRWTSRTVKENGAGEVGRSSQRPEVRSRRCVLGRLHWGEADSSRVSETWEGAGNAWLVTAPLAESVLGIRCYAELPACGSQHPPQSLCTSSLSRRQGGRGQELQQVGPLCPLATG